MRTIIAAFSLIPLLFMAVGVWLVHDQSRKLNTFMPVEAEVVSVRVEGSGQRGCS